MSTLTLDVIGEAASLMADPSYRRMSQTDWLVLYNRVQREMASELRVLEFDATFSVTAEQAQYSYPDDLVGIKTIRYSLTPDDPTTFRFLSEIFEDEYRRATNGFSASGDPTRYLARNNSFFLVPTPSDSIANACEITYWGLPATIQADASGIINSTDLMELPDLVRNVFVDGMVIEAKRKLYMYAEADRDHQAWLERLSFLKERIEDRSQDRRPALRPKSLQRGWYELT